MLNGKSILVTGGTGSFGKKFVETILKRFPEAKFAFNYSSSFKWFNDPQPMTFAELGEMGFRIGIYGISPLVHAIAQMQKVLAELQRGEIGFAGQGMPFDALKDLLGLARWAEIEERSNRLGNALLALGLRKGDRVSTLASNGPEYIEFFFACAKTGIAKVADQLK